MDSNQLGYDPETVLLESREEDATPQEISQLRTAIEECSLPSKGKRHGESRSDTGTAKQTFLTST